MTNNKTSLLLRNRKLDISDISVQIAIAYGILLIVFLLLYIAFLK